MTAGLISAFNPIQDYSNINVPAPSTDDATKFGDVLKTSTENQNQNNLKNDTKPKDEVAKPETKENDNKPEEVKNETKVEDDKTQETKETDKPVEEDAKTEEISEEDIQVISQMLEQIMQAIAQVLEVPVENVQEAVEELGLDVSEVLDTTNVPDIVVELTDATSTMDIMTDEKLYEAVKEITAAVEEIADDTAKEFNIEPQELVQVTREVVTAQVAPKEVTVTGETQPQQVDAEEVDVVETNIAQPVKTVENKEAKGEEAEGRENENQNTEHQVEFTQNTTETVKETPVTETESPVASYTTAKDIINQVADSIKMEIKSDLNELEINLHPASLGNVKVQLISRDGMVTANFTAQNDIVKEAIESQLVSLRESMNEQGVKVEAIEVTVESHAFDENLSKEGERQSKEAEESEAKKKKTRSINLNDGIDEIAEDEDDEVRLAREMMMANGGTVDYLT